MRRCLVIAACLLLCCLSTVAAQDVPRLAYHYRSLLIRSAQAHWGLDAPVATFAAQIHQESGWQADAISSVGALGMAQFMPATADWISDAYPHLQNNEPKSPAWAIAALVTYNKMLWDQTSAMDGCHRMGKTLAGYNGGPGWVRRDERKAAKTGVDPAQYFDGVEKYNAGRRASAKRENVTYARRILFTLEPRYINAGFGQGKCTHD